jgi:5-methylthioadenosine/S-adenosylhomocysteine deaminase
MPAESADLRIDAQFIVPMSSAGTMLRAHSLLVRDGRIVEILPTDKAQERYQATLIVERPSHLLLPGLVNADAQAAMSLTRVMSDKSPSEIAARLGPEFVYDSVLRSMAEMLKSGITCFLDRFYAPQESAQAAHDQGMRAVIGLPLTATPSPWAAEPSEYLSRALRLRDEYRSHPLITTCFAPLNVGELADEPLRRLATLADELEAGIAIDLSESLLREGAGAMHGPLGRFADLNLLSPSFNALHAPKLEAQELALAQRAGIGFCSSPQLSLGARNFASLAALCARGVKLGIASAGARTLRYDVWGEMRIAASLLEGPEAAYQALTLCTSGAAAALGLDDVGTLAPGKWADICCLDLSHPATFAGREDVRTIVSCADRDSVSDVWVAGRALLSNRELVRLDWPSVASKARAWTLLLNQGAQR